MLKLYILCSLMSLLFVLIISCSEDDIDDLYIKPTFTSVGEATENDLSSLVDSSDIAPNPNTWLRRCEADLR